MYATVKIAALAALIALGIYTIRREHKHPLVVKRVVEIVVMEARAEDAPTPQPKEMAREPDRVAKVERECPEYRSQRRLRTDCPAKSAPVEKRALDEWSLPWSCGKVKWAASTFSRETLEKMRVSSGTAPLTAKQKRQAQECIDGRRS